MFWAQDPTPCWAPSPGLDISLMLEGDSPSCENHHSCCLLQGNCTSYLLTSLAPRSLPMPSPDHSAPCSPSH